MASAFEIKILLDNELKPDKMGKNFEEINKNAIIFFQKLFVEQLNFDLIEGDFGEIGENIPTKEWNKAAEAQKAYFISEKDDFRIIYVCIKKISRYRERSAISSLKRENWAIKGEYICIFYAEDSEIWHMVCPHYTEGRTILRRYILGEGENHRTVSINLQNMDASLAEPLFERVQEAFKVQVVTEKFYERYKEVFNEIKNHLIKQRIDISDAKKSTHLLLNRLMFIYFIQKKGWMNNDKKFMANLLKMYVDSRETNLLYEKWLKKLFFIAMSTPVSEKSINDFGDELNNILNNLPYLNGGLFEQYDVDELDFLLSDDLLFMIIENFLEEYNFTITEESPFDLDIAIDPAMLGKLYESLIAEEERGKAGIFYTPRLEVDLMCRLAIYKYLLQDRNTILPEKENIEILILKFIFDPLEDWDLNKSKEYEFLRKALNQIKIVDPACGSGAFLVGMLNVLSELFLKLGVLLDYNLKENVIHNSIYGVDIKDWAIRMAEFRLWLYIIENEQNPPNKSPILPNFSFKLQRGDSLVQKIKGTNIKLKKYRTKLFNDIQEELEEISNLKKQFFEGNKDIFDLIKKKQTSLILNALKNKIKKYKLLISQKSQRNLRGEITEEAKKEIIKLEGKKKAKSELVQRIQNNINEEFFIWELNYPEVMLYGGFDIVIANPPYVRQEKIINQGIDPEKILEFTSKEISKLKTQYKEALNDSIKNLFDLTIGKKCDLYVYFFFKAMDLINKDGVIVFISSLSWLDSDYGKYLQEGFLKNVKLEYIVDNQAIRSFEEASVNTVITVLKGKEKKGFLQGETEFITLYKAFEEINNTQIATEIFFNDWSIKPKTITYFGENFRLIEKENYRKVSIDEKSLWKLGLEDSETIQTTLTSTKAIGNYETGQWGKFLRGAIIYFKILDKNQDSLVPLKDLANLRRGFTTGANEFFYVPKAGKTYKFFKSKLSEDKKFLILYPKNKKCYEYFRKMGYDIEENDYIFRIETEFLRDIIFTLKEIKNYHVDIENLNKYFVALRSEQIEGKEILNYVNWGVTQGYSNRPTLRSKRDWVDLILDKDPAPLIFPSKVGERLPVAINSSRIFEDKKQYGIFPIVEEDLEILYLVLNSSFFRLFIEIESRQLTGAQAIIDIDVVVVSNVKIPNIREIDEKIKQELINLKEELEGSKAESIREELGALNSEDFDIDKIKEIRRKIDNIVMGKILGLNKEEQIELYKALIDIIKNRLDKAKSV